MYKLKVVAYNLDVHFVKFSNLVNFVIAWLCPNTLLVLNVAATSFRDFCETVFRRVLFSRFKLEDMKKKALKFAIQAFSTSLKFWKVQDTLEQAKRICTFFYESSDSVKRWLDNFSSLLYLWNLCKSTLLHSRRYKI